MVEKENGKIDFFRWLKRKLQRRRVGDIRFENADATGAFFPLCYETIKQKDGTKKKHAVAWCPYAGIPMKDIELSKDTVRSIELVEEAVSVDKRDMFWQTSNVWYNFIWTVHVYLVRIAVDNPLVAREGPAVMTAIMRVVPTFGKELFSFMGIDAECPEIEGYAVTRAE